MWLTLLSASAWAQSPYDNLVPGQWTVISKNVMSDVNPCPANNCSYSAVEGQSAVIDDWCGGAFASGVGTLGGLVTWGGGHNGYFGSEFYLFDLGAQTWSRYTNPYDDGSASVASNCSTNGVYPDGSPCPTHTYNAIEYHAQTNRLVILNGTPDPVLGGSYDSRAHVFDFGTKTWKVGAQAPNGLGYDAPSGYDAKRNLFWQLTGYTYKFLSYDPVQDVWTDYGSPGSWEIDGAGKIDPVHDIFVFIDARGTGKMYALQPADPTAAMIELTTAGDTQIQTMTQMGFEWEPLSQRFVAWHDGSDVYVLNPPSGDWKTGTWTWARVPAAAGNAVVPTANPNGTYGRWRYAASINAFILLSDSAGPVWAYRLTPGAGTGTNPPPDAGSSDAGSSDAGMTAGTDAGAVAPDAGNAAPDGGGSPGTPIVRGCGCGAVGPAGFLLPVLLVLICYRTARTVLAGRPARLVFTPSAVANPAPRSDCAIAVGSTASNIDARCSRCSG